MREVSGEWGGYLDVTGWRNLRHEELLGSYSSKKKNIIRITMIR
jgi:hypothetical protein